MQMTQKADLLTEGIVKKLNLLIEADQLTGYALTVRAPGEQEAMYGAGSTHRGHEEMLVWAAKFIAAVAKDRQKIRGEWPMKEMKDKRDRDKRVVKALNEAAAVMDRMKDTGDIDGFAVVTQRPELGPVSQPDTGVSIAINASDKQLVVWAAVLARTAIQRGGYSPILVARDLTRMIIEWGRYEREYRAYKVEQDEEE